jgi:twitching motility protein PilT
MKTLQHMLRELGRAEVAEVAVASDRLPCVKIGGKYQAIDDQALSTEAILEMLAASGGSRYVDELGAQPAAWTLRLDGIGSVGVQAAMREGRVQARFVVVRKASVSAMPAVKLGERTGTSRASARPTEGRERTQIPTSARPTDGRVRTQTPTSARPTDGRVRTQTPTSRPVPSVKARPSRPPGRKSIPASRAPARRSSTPALRLPKHSKPPTGVTAMGASTATERTAAVVAPGAAAAEDIGPLLAAAREAGASDLHVVAGRPMLLRLAGDLVARGAVLSDEAVASLILPLVPERLAPVLANDGSCDFALDRGAAGRFRVNVSRQRTGYKACFRLIASQIPTLASLGLPPEIERATHHHQGMVIVTGPTGHGKTSTLAAILDIVNSETTHHVITVEDPVEFVHPPKKAMMTQREVGTHTQSFATALKAALREDPDVIVVGELRDTETVRMALAASETGHLVLGTMNTPSAAKTIDRLIDLFPPADQAQVRMTLAGGLHLVISQRLLPAASPQGAADTGRGASLLQAADTEGAAGPRGMVAAVELLPGSVALWSLIRDNKTFQIPSLQQRGKGFGILRLDESLLDLVRAGRVIREAALAVAEAPDDLEAILDGKRPAPGVPAAAPAPAKTAAPGGLLGKAGQIFGKRGS